MDFEVRDCGETGHGGLIPERGRGLLCELVSRRLLVYSYRAMPDSQARCGDSVGIPALLLGFPIPPLKAVLGRLTMKLHRGRW